MTFPGPTYSINYSLIDNQAFTVLSTYWASVSVNLSSLHSILSRTAFSSYQLDTSDILDGQDVQLSNENHLLGPFDTYQIPGMTQYRMDLCEGLEEVEEPKSNTRPKLGCKRASSACKQCRHRKIRCIASFSDARARCISCVRLKKNCSSYLTGQSSANGSSLIRVARFSPAPDRSLDANDLAQTSASMVRYLDGPKPPLDQSKMRATTSVVPISTGMPWTDGFVPQMRVSTVADQMNLNMRSQSLPGWDVPVVGQNLNSNAVGLDLTQRVQLSEVPTISQFSTLADISSPSTSSISESANALSQADLNFPWNSNSYARPMRFISELSESANIGDMFIGGGEAVFDFHASSAPSTNQPLPLQINSAAQGRSQSLPYNGYAFYMYWE